MKCIAGLIVLVAAPLAVSANSFKHILTATGETRILSAASSSNIKQDAGPKTMATDSRPKVTNGGVNFYPYTSDIRQYIVDAHNSARATMVPSTAANMRKVSWDESLAIEAAELVNTCVFEHDTENYAYGQNLMYGGRSIDKTTVDSWMDAWVKDEISSSDRAGNGYMDLDHASAVLWATTYLVGCASKMCPNGYLTACNYYTPGNWQGEQTYMPGTPCSQCPSQAPYCDASGKLCTAEQTTTPTSAPVPSPTPTPKPAPVPSPTPAATTNAPSPGQQQQDQYQQNQPAATPAATTLDGVPVPTPAATTTDGLPVPTPAATSTDGSPLPTPAATWMDENSGSALPGSASSTLGDSDVAQHPVSENSEPTPTPSSTSKWGDFETSPAVKPTLPSAIAVLCGLVAMVRAM